MKLALTSISLLLAVLPFWGVIGGERVEAQSITSADDGTDTLVTPNGNQLNISGGQLSGDGANLFHSFTQFGLSSDQIANFLSNPNIQNILGRVVGGDASVINGLIQVTGGNSHLFLLNPAGIIFGTSASLNVPASFTATTANGIGFGSSWFSSADPNNYAALVGTPNTFAFTMSQPGSIVNAGNLAVGQGQNLTLLGGTVVSTGQLFAPGGNITISAVMGESLVRLTQVGNPLSLEIQPSPTLPLSSSLSLSLPQLLTGGSAGSATRLTVNSNGQVILSGSGTSIPADSGTAVVSGTLNVQGETGGGVQVLGDKVGLFGANINASGTNGGGTVLIGGDYQGKGTVPNASRTYISTDSVIVADSFLNGNGGRVIVWADEVTGFYGNISARGGSNSGNGGFVEVSGKENLIFNGTVNLSAENGSLGSLLLDPLNITIVAGNGGVDDFQVNGGQILAGTPGGKFTISEAALQLLAAEANITLQANNDISISNLTDDQLSFPATTGSITLTADADMDGFGSFSMDDAGDTISTQGGAVTISGASVDIGNIATRGGNISITATDGDIKLTGTGQGIQAGTFNSNGGNITLNAADNITRTGSSSIASNVDIGKGNGGNITLNAGGNITDVPVSSSSLSEGNGGDIIFNAGGNIKHIGITATANNGNGGNISLNSDGNITANEAAIRSCSTSVVGSCSGGSGSSGNITLNSRSGSITTGGTLDATSSSGNGGAITLTAPINITATAINSSGLSGTGDIHLTSNEINLSGVEGKGTLLIQPFTPSQNITIGGSNDTSALDLTATDLAALNNGFSSITIGRTDSSGDITVPKSVTFNDPVTIQAPVDSGSITAIGAITGKDDASITLRANNNITTGNITAIPGITLTSTAGAINTIAGELNSGSVSGKAGGITLFANDNITTSKLNSASRGSGADGGNITLTSSNGKINTAGSLDSTSDSGIGGAITLQANSDITTFALISVSPGSGTGGEITLNSTVGAIDTTRGKLFAGSVSGNGSAIYLEAYGNITTGAEVGTRSRGAGTDAGTITLISKTGYIDTTAGVVQSSSVGEDDLVNGGNQSNGGNGGAIFLQASGDIKTADVFSFSSGSGNGGNITLISAEGAIDTGDLNYSQDAKYSSNFGNGGAIFLQANGDITTGNTNSNGWLGSGNITLTSSKGNINATAGTLDATSGSGQGGVIALTSQTGIVTSGDLSSFGATAGGNITVSAKERIETGVINSSSSLGNGGDVTLDPLGDIEVTSINAQGGNNGTGGNVDITTEHFFRASGIFTDKNGTVSSISTADSGGGGSITIRHTGGSLGTPFDVGDATTNGTAGAITTGSGNTISPFQSFPGPYTQGNIQIITAAQPVPPEQPPTPSPITAAQPVPPELPPTPSLIPEIIPDSPVPIEKIFTEEFENYLGQPAEKIRLKTLAEIRNTLRKIEEETGVKPAVIYVNFVPAEIEPDAASDGTKSLQRLQKPEITSPLAFQGVNPNYLAQSQAKLQQQPDDQLELVLVTGSGNPIRKRVPEAVRSQVLSSAQAFRRQVTDASKTRTKSYMVPARQLYQWMIDPLKTDLQAQGIENLVFILDAGLRSVPLAALHDGQKFLVEEYSIALMPSVSLTDTRYVDVKNTQLLAMGASKFTEQNPLPAVPAELSILTKDLWKGKPFLNEAFTLDNLKSQRAATPFGIIHLATHGEFKPGVPGNSYIQLWDTKLRLDQLRQLRWNDPSVEMLVLSACRMAIGDEEAELGFAGLATQAGVKSAVASLWYVSDEGTLGLMTQFYAQLMTAPIKAEALRQAQIAMLKGEVRLQQGQLRWSGGEFSLPPELQQLGTRNLSHPYYWSAFTMIGNPW